MSEPAYVFLITLTIVTGTFLGWRLLTPLMQALGRRLESRAAPDHPAVAQELAELRERVHELEQHQARVVELEERLDFAERMLTRGRPPIDRADTPPEPLDVVHG